MSDKNPSKFERAAKAFMEKQLTLQDKVKEEGELIRLLKQFYDLGRMTSSSKK